MTTTPYQPAGIATNGHKVEPNSTNGNGNSPIRAIATGVSNLKSDLEKSPLWDSPEITHKIARLEQLTTAVEQKFQPVWDAAIEAKFKTEQEKLLAIASSIRQAPNWDSKLKTTVTELQQILQCDRVLVYRFQGQHHGAVMAEATLVEGTPFLGQFLDSSAFGATGAAEYRTRLIVAIDDISDIQLTPQQMQQWNKLQAKASLSVPLLVGEQVWGLLVVQQCSATRHWLETEINLLHNIATELTIHLQQSEFRWQLQLQPEQERTINNVLSRIRQSQNLDTLFRATCREVRQLLKVDRVVVFRFFPDFNEGEFIAEDVQQGYVVTLGNRFSDCHFSRDYAPQYRQGRIQAVADIFNGGLSECHAQQLAQFQVRANLIVPLMKGEELWGMLCIHQCRGPHEWQTHEIEFVKRIAAQFGMALAQADYLEQLHEKTERLAIVAEREQNYIQVLGKIGQSIADQIQQSLEIKTIFQSATQQIRRALKADRAVVYRFNPDWSGNFVVESVANGLMPIITQQSKEDNLVSGIVECGMLRLGDVVQPRLADTHMQKTRGGGFQQRQSFVVDDVYKAGFSDCYIEALEQYEWRCCKIKPLNNCGQNLKNWRC
jgi:methyl-accepting chemotaxis protein PixJ